jgi:hypothetical protein
MNEEAAVVAGQSIEGRGSDVDAEPGRWEDSSNIQYSHIICCIREHDNEYLAKPCNYIKWVIRTYLVPLFETNIV